MGPGFPVPAADIGAVIKPDGPGALHTPVPRKIDAPFLQAILPMSTKEIKQG